MSESRTIGSGELGCAVARNGDRQGVVFRRLDATAVSGAKKTSLALERRWLLLLRDFDRRVGLVIPQALGITGGYDAKAEQNNQNP